MPSGADACSANHPAVAALRHAALPARRRRRTDDCVVQRQQGAWRPRQSHPAPAGTSRASSRRRARLAARPHPLGGGHPAGLWQGSSRGLPAVPQEVGDAVLEYICRARPVSDSDVVFLRSSAPYQSFAGSSTISSLVRLALARAGISDPPLRGANLLRHSAATSMLRAGATLDTIGAVLRHRSATTTAHYAKVDVPMLLQVAQPWPGEASC